MRAVCLSILLLTSCGVAKKNNGSAGKNVENTIVFAVMKMYNEVQGTEGKVKLLSTTESSGTMKTLGRVLDFDGAYLSVHILDNKKVRDSLVVEHPLHKHLEYLDANNQYAVKDTVLEEAEFFIRFQSPGNSIRLKIFEVTEGKGRREIALIKL